MIINFSLFVFFLYIFVILSFFVVFVSRQQAFFSTGAPPVEVWAMLLTWKLRIGNSFSIFFWFLYFFYIFDSRQKQKFSVVAPSPTKKFRQLTWNFNLQLFIHGYFFYFFIRGFESFYIFFKGISYGILMQWHQSPT